jgi:ABC-type Mn2+/Zn2+ transport system permease subunit
MPDLVAPFEQEFVRLAVAEIALVGLAGAVVGCWVVLYGLSYAAESLSHALLPGLVAAGLIGVPALAGGAVGAGVAAVAIAAVAGVRRLDRDVATVVVTTALGGGALLALAPATPRGLAAALFGDVLAVSPRDLAATAAIVAVLAVVLAVLHRRLLAGGFDDSASGATRVVLLVCIAAAVLVGTRALGSLLVVAILVAPAATARLVTRRVPAMLATSVAVAVGAGVAGIEISYHAGTAAGASIALCLVGAYLVAALLGRGAVRAGAA